MPFSFWLTSLCITGSVFIHISSTDSNSFLHSWLSNRCICALQLLYPSICCLFVCLFLRNVHTVLHSGYIHLYYHQQCKSFLFPTYSTELTVYRFLMMVILTGGRWYLIVVLISISLIISNVEYLFMCLLAICMSSLEKCLFRASVHYLLGCLKTSFFYLLVTSCFSVISYYFSLVSFFFLLYTLQTSNFLYYFL